MQKALAALHDHNFFLQTDPNLLSIQATDTDTDTDTDTQQQQQQPPPPPDGTLLQTPPPDCATTPPPTTTTTTSTKRTIRHYDVVSRAPVAGFFADLLPDVKTVTNHYQITNTSDGISVSLQAPLEITQERRWVVEGYNSGENGEGLLVGKITEYLTISCPGTMLYGSVKSEQDSQWKKVHAAYVQKLGGEVVMQVFG